MLYLIKRVLNNIFVRNFSLLTKFILGLKAKYRNSDKEFIYPYDLGWQKNLSLIFNGGSEFAKGNGIWWPTLCGCDQFTLTVFWLNIRKSCENFKDLFII